MKIALLGAPGSGKTKIARRIARRLNPNWAIIDGYTEKFSRRTGIDLNQVDAYSFRHNLQLATLRWTLEDEAQHRGSHTITCGTIYETIVYSASYTLILPQISDEQVLLQESQASQLFMSTLGMLGLRYFDYDVLFYLPLEGDIERDWRMVVDAKLPEVLESQYKYAVALTGTDKQKVDRALEIIQPILAASQTPKDEQPAV